MRILKICLIMMLCILAYEASAQRKTTEKKAEKLELKTEKGTQKSNENKKKTGKEKKTSHNKPLSGCCFYVVSGHGGPDPGAIGHLEGHELHEDEYAYDVAARLAQVLEGQGAMVRMIIQDEKDGIRNDRYLNNSKCETCCGDPIPPGQKERLEQRCAAINRFYGKDCKRYKYIRSIFLHVDSRSKSAQTDVFFYHAIGSKYGKRLATTVKDMFESKYDKHQPNRGFTGTVSARNLYVLRNSTPVALFVELGNIQNAFDQRRFILSNNRQALANWLMQGIQADKKKQ